MVLHGAAWCVSFFPHASLYSDISSFVGTYEHTSTDVLYSSNNPTQIDLNAFLSASRIEDGTIGAYFRINIRNPGILSIQSYLVLSGIKEYSPSIVV